MDINEWVMLILDEFKKLCDFYRKKYKNQSAFRSLKMVKNEQGEKEPVFYIGVPGMMVALTFSFVIIATVYILYLPFMWYVWVPYVIFLVFLFRISMKYDKARQIRFMVYYLLESSLKMLETAENEEDENKKRESVAKALKWLEKADKWVDEPALTAQINALDK